MPTTAAVSPVAWNNFGELLRYLRRRARLQQRDLAIAVGYSESQICRLEQNQRLPDLATLAALFVPALDLEETPELAATLLELAAAARGEQAEGLALASKQLLPAGRPIAGAGGANAVLGNLPAPLTPLVNRTRELAAARDSLGRPDLRLLTMVGPPGIGKTRLSLHVAAELTAQFGDGVFFVALAPIRDPALVLPTIAHVLGVKQRVGQQLIGALRDALRDRRLLLILDNFEHVLAAATQVSELLRAAPQLKALVTSRAALHLSGEHLFVVPPLELPDLCALPPLDELAAYPAVQLFLTRIAAIQPGFTLNTSNARAIAEICDCLDGLPLAIELAAARGRLFSPQALLERLRSASGPTALQFLTGGPRDLPAHQQTLRSTIDWSYDLLDEHERCLLMQLSIFVGGCTPEAAELVCHDCSGGVAATMLLDGLHALVDKSLLRYDTGADAQPRFTMLETIREYAREKLVAAGQAESLRRRYIGYYLALAQTAARELNGARQEHWFRRLEQEYDNFRAALEWLAAHDPADGLRLATSLRQFWPTRGYLSQGRWWFEAMLADAPASAIPAELRARGLCVAGYLACQQGDLQTAERLSQASLALSRPLGEQRCVVDTLLNIGSVAYYHNEYARAASLFSECLAAYRELGAPAEAALALKNLGMIAKDQGDFASANSFYAESLAIRRELGDKRGVAQALFSLGVVAYWQGDYSNALALSEQCVVSYRELGDQMGAAYALDTLGMAAYKQCDYPQAIGWLEASLRMLRELGDMCGVALLLTDLGLVARSQGDCERAARLHAEALAIALKIGDKRRIAFCLEGLAVAFGPARARDSARLLGAAEALREAIGAPLPQAELADYAGGVASVRRNCAAAEFAAAWALGRAMPLEQVAACARLADQAGAAPKPELDSEAGKTRPDQHLPAIV